MEKLPLTPHRCIMHQQQRPVSSKNSPKCTAIALYFFLTTLQEGRGRKKMEDKNEF